MYQHETKLRVRYGETDQMGYAYYGNYAQYFEVGRVEMLRSLGVTYKEMEDEGIALPVYTFSIKYFKPAYYDDELTIRTTIKKMPAARIEFHYETFNAKGDLLNEGDTTLVFIDKNTKRPCPPPERFIIQFRPFFGH